MTRRTLFGLFALCGAAGLALSGRAQDAPKPPAFEPADAAFYEREVAPILREHCHKCHAGEKVKGGFSLETRDRLLAGGDLGPAIDWTTPHASNLLKAVRYEDDMEMPPSGRLPAAKIAVLTKWVELKAPYPAGALVAKASVVPKHVPGRITDADRAYWAYRPLANPPVPAVKDSAWVKNPIDSFILASLEAKGLTPAKPADKLTLIRRLYYDLTGLPPTPEEVDAFANDGAPNAYEKLVDRLLASPHYGEKWGRHWLDLVRYAETNGYERDGPKPNAWRYRDYVIRSFNADKPVDRFMKEQLAGDEIDRDDPDCVTATGFYRLGTWDDEPADPDQATFDEFDDLVQTTGQVFLGMTLNCARCHDHKIDPIRQSDYYSMVAFFRDIRRYSDNRDTHSPNSQSDITSPDRRKTYEADQARRDARQAQLRESMTRLEDVVIKRMPAEDQRASEGIDRPRVVAKLGAFFQGEERREYDTLKRQWDGLRKRPSPVKESALSVNRCLSQPPGTQILIRGNPHAPGAPVEPAFPAVLGVPPPKVARPAAGKSSGRRTALAEWVASRENGVTARVFVNRLWQHHFGKGIVATSNDFGKLGERPTHPELLDWLGAEFTRGGWTVKRMHRLIVTSSAYRMSGASDTKALATDPANKLLWRFPARRLGAEEVRDSILAVSGSLNRALYGPSVYPPIPAEVLAGQSVPGQGWHTSKGADADRRSVYVHVKRSLQVPVLIQHDQADPDSTCPVRYTTTVPTQALGMLNGAFANEQAGKLAERLRRERPGSLEDQVRRGARLAHGRDPSAAEVAADVAFVRELGAKHHLSDAEALRQYALMLLNTNEFVYLD